VAADRKIRVSGAPPQTPEFSAFAPGLAFHLRLLWVAGEPWTPQPIPASGSALGSLSSGDLSSVRVGVVYRKLVSVGA
jgi:hypothetical protein